MAAVETKRRFLRGVVIVLATATTLLVAELTTRNYAPQIFPLHPAGLYQPDPETGHVLTPSFSGVFERSDFSVSIRTNEAGLRGALPSATSQGAFRVVCLGDSMTWGWGIEEDEAYPAVVEALLRERYPGRAITVINAGVPFFGTVEQLAFLRRHGASWQPQVVTLLFNVTDDHKQNRVPSVQRYEFRDGLMVPRREFVKGMEPLWLRLLNDLKHHIHLVRWTSERAGQLLMRVDLLDRLEKTPDESATLEDLDRGSAALAGVAGAARTLGAIPVFILAPDKRQVLAGRQSADRTRAMIAQAAVDNGAHFVDLTPVLLEYPRRSALYGRQEGYLTVEGQRVLAHVIADVIQEEVLTARDS